LLALVSAVFAFPNKTYKVIPGQIDKENASVDVTIKNTALG
jgi:hypothetical protein